MPRYPATLIVCAVLALTYSISDPPLLNKTEAYFRSPHGLGRTQEVDSALTKINSQIRVKTITYNKSSISYNISNIVIGTSYNDAKQNVTIPEADTVQVTGGRVQFTYSFNYSKTESMKTVNGYGYGSVLSDSLTYFKEMKFCQSFLCWVLKNKGYTNLTINSTMQLKRMEPFDATDKLNLEQMLFNATSGIDPSTCRSQILTLFNQIFPLALNDSLNHQIFNEKINYSFHSNTHGEMKMTVLHNVYGFGINVQNGSKVIFATQIDSFEPPFCLKDIPEVPADFSVYGGSQTYHMNCLYENVVKYLQFNGWLNTVLNQNWESNSFQFYAGDLFDLINNLHQAFPSQSALNGTCQAQKEGISFTSQREFEANTFSLVVNYNCTLRGANKLDQIMEVIKATPKVKFVIKVEALTKTLSFKIIAASLLTISFEPVNNYFIFNLALATFKANSLLKKLQNMSVFGTNFPTMERDVPKTKVSEGYTFYYDDSHKDSAKLNTDQ